MEYSSQELSNATTVRSSITHVNPPNIDIDSIKDDIRTLLFLKDRKLMNIYETALMSRGQNISGSESLKDILHLIRNYITSKYREDNIKNLTIRKQFDIMIFSLETLILNKIDIDSNEMNTIILGFLVKNFI
jgi:hypothetical protein